MLNSRVIQFKPQRTASVGDVIAELRRVIAGANPNFRFTCPSADINALLAGVLPDEIRLFIDDPFAFVKSGPQSDTNFVTSYNAGIFRDVIVSEVWRAAPSPDEDGIRFSDYSLLVLTEAGLTAVPKQVSDSGDVLMSL
jgi:hypothetical protein